eukprot:6666193-Pyramimonas_sp.AAC.1
MPCGAGGAGGRGPGDSVWQASARRLERPPARLPPEGLVRGGSRGRRISHALHHAGDCAQECGLQAGGLGGECADQGAHREGLACPPAGLPAGPQPPGQHLPAGRHRARRGAAG